MIESIEFANFKALRNTTLSLAKFTLLLGPNGSGKSSVLQALQGIATIVAQASGQLIHGRGMSGSAVWRALPSATALESPVQMTVRINWQKILGNIVFEWPAKSGQMRVVPQLRNADGGSIPPASLATLVQALAGMQTYALDPVMIAQHVPVNSGSLKYNGMGLAAVLDDLKDNYPERWELLLGEFREWLPEYDHIQFIKPQEGHKGLALRTKNGGHRIPASELSQGTLVALALLALAYQPNPPALIGLEEIDRGLHPRLLRHLQDALYRLTYPESCGEKRPPIQVIATTHSPYLLDLYREHPEEVVLAQKEGLEVQFKQLSKIEHFQEILGDSPLSDVWYSGVLGGVTVKP